MVTVSPHHLNLLPFRVGLLAEFTYSMVIQTSASVSLSLQQLSCIMHIQIAFVIDFPFTFLKVVACVCACLFCEGGYWR